MKRNNDRALNVMFGDFCYYNRHTFHSRYVPLAIGLIAQYAKQQFGKDINVSLFKRIEKFLERASQNPPDVVGLSVYFWNLAINQYLVKRLREMFGQNVTIIIGGPCIDSNEQEQHKFLSTVFPNADAIVINEGEIGFSNILRKILGNRKTVFKDSIDGVSFLNGNRLVQGLPVGLSMDLSTMGSPYLSGLLDEFMNSEYQPLIQTSRLCPYTCTFCVSGKNRGKLRGYPIRQVEEELKYVSKKYAERPHHTVYMVDENFGILKRDVEIAKMLVKCKEDFGFPQSVFFYNDKRFTETSRAVCETLKGLSRGVCLSLQTENPETLKAINRRNVTVNEIDDAIAWAIKRDIEVTTELIFGLPHETKDGFVDLMNRSIDRGFDNVKINNLVVMDGIELNRPDVRKKYNIKTKYRSTGTHYGTHEGTFIAEHEEVVVSTNSFTYEDFLDIRYLNFMFYAVFYMDFQKYFFHFIKSKGITQSDFFSRFMKPNRNLNWPKEYLCFLDDISAEVEGELYDTRAEMVAGLKKIFENKNNDVGEASRINISFGARLIYQENYWVKTVLLRHFDDVADRKLSGDDRNLASSLIDLAEIERIDLKGLGEKKPLDFSFDIINWKKNKFKKSLCDLKMQTKPIRFLVDESRVTKIRDLKKRFASYTNKDFYNLAVSFIVPRSNLLHVMEYDDRYRVDDHESKLHT